MLTIGITKTSTTNLDQSALDFMTSFPNVTDEAAASNDLSNDLSSDLYQRLWNSSSSSDSRIGRYKLEEIFDIYRPGTAMFNKCVTPILYAIGLPGNFLAFLVWIRPRMRPSSGCYLAALALTDFVFIILQVVFELQFTWRAITWLDLPLVCELFPVVFLASQYLSLLLVLGFSVERYIAVCHPFKRDIYCTTSRAVRVIPSLIAFSILLNSVQGYFWTHSLEPEGSCHIRPEVTSSEGASMSVWAIWSWLTEMMLFVVVSLLIFVLNAMVIAEYRKVSAKERQLTGSMIHRGNPGAGSRGRSRTRPRQFAPSSATTGMLLAVSFYLIASTLPVTICYVLFPSFQPGNHSMTDSEVWTDTTWQNYLDYWTAKVVVQELGMSHFAFNFIIYLTTGRIFRRELKMLVVGPGVRSCGKGRGSFSRSKNISQISRDLGTNGVTGYDVRHPEMANTQTLLKYDDEFNAIKSISNTFV